MMARGRVRFLACDFKPAAVSLYMCRGGFPVSGDSQRVCSNFIDASRMRSGYKVPDFRPVWRLMS